MTTSWISEPNKHIEQYLDYYCGDQKQSGYAVLINGDWGSGKTWFIKKYIDKIRANDPSKKVAYISLNGISKTSDIDDEIFKCIHPRLASKEAKLAGKILKGAVKAAFRFDLDGDNRPDTTMNVSVPNVDLPDYLKINDKFLLVFDDLERCELKIEEALGYINYFVEQEGIKTIIISNESEVGEGGVENVKYKRKKEKLVDASFKYIEDSHVAVDCILKEIQNNNLKLEIMPQKDFIREIFEQVGSKNLRAFKQTIYAFERFYQKKYFEFNGVFDQELFKKILKSFIVLSLENKKGMFCGEILSFPEADNSNKTPDERARDKIGDALRGFAGEGASKFSNKYNFKIGDFILSAKNWDDILNHNILDENLIGKELYDSYFILKNEPPVWRKLLDFFDLSEEDFLELISEAENIIKTGAVDDVGELKHMVSMFIYFKKHSLIGIDIDVLIAKALEIIKVIFSANFDFKQKNYEVDRDQAHSFGFYSSGDASFNKFLDDVQECYKVLYNDRLLEKSIDLFNLMDGDSDLFYQRINLTNSLENLYWNVSILRYIDVNDFSNKIYSLKKVNLYRVLRALESRYSLDYDKKNIYLEERDWLNSVIKSIHDKLLSDTLILSRYKAIEIILPSLQKAKESLDQIASS